MEFFVTSPLKYWPLHLTRSFSKDVLRHTFLEICIVNSRKNPVTNTSVHKLLLNSATAKDNTRDTAQTLLVGE